MSIRVLPKLLVDKIAAGEVIERPASVVKEAVENSIDAGAGRIEVELEHGGARLIRVADDGAGMDEADLALALMSHATSKLAAEEDLFSVRTMGFRGEALASIAAVSQARLVSRTARQDAGAEVRAEAGVVGAVKACAAPPGTQLEVRNLFFNVPVRRKFLRSPATEMAHVTEAVTRVALAHPEIAFVLTHNGRAVFNLSPAVGHADRIAEFFGGQIAQSLIPLAERHPEVEIEGFLLPPSVDRANTTMQYTYVNRRYVRERTITHAVQEAYHGLLRPRRKPVCFLLLTLDPAQVDVNVHPSKIEIRLRRAREVHARLLHAVRDTLRQAGLIPQVSISGHSPAPQEERKESIRTAIADFFASCPEVVPPASARAAAPSRRPAAGQSPPATPAVAAYTGNAIQILDTYIVAESPDGIRITDQHALHERILYDAMERRLHQGPLASQRLLVPELVELSPAELLALTDVREELARFGLEIEPFGANTVIVRSLPQVLGRLDARVFLRDLLDEMDGPDGLRALKGRLEDLTRLMACRGAVKAGERLAPRQIRELLSQCVPGETDTCPHGRPTSILITRDELERHFRRT